MNKRGARLFLLALCLAACLLLCGCSAQISERPLENLADDAITVQTAAPKQDGADARRELVTLYFLDESGTMLRPVVRGIEISGGMSRAEAAVHALLRGPLGNEEGAMWPDIGAARNGRFVETAAGIATVNLPARARTLPQEMLYAVRMAIASTLTEFAEISYVNVLVGGREEGLDLGATLPVGTFSRMEELDAGARYSRLQEQRQSDSGVTLLTTLYFPSKDGTMIVPQVRSMAYSQVLPIEYLYTLLAEMGKGAGQALCMQDVPAPMDYIVEMPEIVRTEDGYLASELSFDRELEEDLTRSGMTLGVYAAMLTDTLMGFVPGVEGLKISVGDEAVKELLPQQTPDGHGLSFEHGLATRNAFSGYVGAPVTLYITGEEGLRAQQYVMRQDRAHAARARLEALIEQDAGLSAAGLTGADVLAVYEGLDVIAVDLSESFGRVIASLSPEEERAAVYAMVNTLTEGARSSEVQFSFEGEQVGTLAGALEMRGSFVRNPGMVVN